MLSSSLRTLTVLALLTPLARSQDSAAVPIGGPGSLSSSGFDDPGLLGDGETEARARLEFTLDDAASTLTLVVENLSPVLPGVPNPVITRVYFNAPGAITGMSLLSQNAAAGTSAFALSFDGNRLRGVQPNKAGRLGSFSVHLDNGNGIQGGIANALADTLPAQNLVTGPVTFVIGLQGDLSQVDAEDFVSERSSNPPGSASVVAAAKFQGGGEKGASAFIGNSEPFCPIASFIEDLGGGCGARLECTLPMLGELWRGTVDSNVPDALGVLVLSENNPSSTFINGCEILLDLDSTNALLFFRTDANGDAQLEVLMPTFLQSPACCGAEHLVQVAIFSGGRLVEATNACHDRLGS